MFCPRTQHNVPGQAGLEPGPLDTGSCTLTMKPLRLPPTYYIHFTLLSASWVIRTTWLEIQSKKKLFMTLLFYSFDLINETNKFKFTIEMNWSWYLFFGIPKYCLFVSIHSLCAFGITGNVWQKLCLIK